MSNLFSTKKVQENNTASLWIDCLKHYSMINVDFIIFVIFYYKQKNHLKNYIIVINIIKINLKNELILSWFPFMYIYLKHNYLYYQLGIELI